MFERVARGWALTKTSFKVLSLDKEILWLPLMAGVAMILAVAAGFGAFGILADNSPLTYLLLFGVYVLTYGIAIFFNTAVIEMATIRFNGGDPVLKDGLKMASRRIVRILQWALVAATVGLIFRMLRDQARDSFFAQIVLSLIQGAWDLVTFFVIPVAVYQDLGPFQAIKGSTRLVRRTFGEAVTGIITTTYLFLALGLLGLVPLVLALFYAPGALPAVLAVVVLYWLVLAAVNSAIDGILVAALYKYANEGVMPQAFREQGVDAPGLAW